MDSGLALLVIEIGLDPELSDIFGLTLTWHGIFTALGIAGGVFVAVVVGRWRGFLEDDVYSEALIAIPAGIIGARALYVVERWSRFSDDWVDIFRVNEGGISVYGAVLGGVVGGLIYVWMRKLPMRRALDVAAPGIILGLAIGRIGDLINGEHFSKLSDLPWAVRYTHAFSPSRLSHPLDDCVVSGIGQITGGGEALCSQHPAVGYEMVGDLLIFGVVLLILRFVAKDGVALFSMLLLYSLMRFGVSELRLDSREIFGGLTTPQVTALFMIPVGLLGILYSLRQDPAPPVEAPEPAASSP